MNQERDDRLWELTRQLVAQMIPFNPPLTEEQMEGMKINNPEGYALLQEYLKLAKEEEDDTSTKI